MRGLMESNYYKFIALKKKYTLGKSQEKAVVSEHGLIFMMLL